MVKRMKVRNSNSQKILPLTSASFFHYYAEPKTKVAISSSDTLELTVSKTFLDVINDLSKAFSDAIRPGGLNKPELVAPYIVENETGFDITLNLKNGDLNLHSSHFPNAHGSVSELNKSGVVFQVASADVDPDAVTTCKISPGGKAYMQVKQTTSLAKISAFGSLDNDAQKEMALHVQVSLGWIFSNNYRLARMLNCVFSLQIGEITKDVVLPIHKADRRYFPLYRDTNKEPWGIISHVRNEYGSTVITIHGVVKVSRNE